MNLRITGRNIEATEPIKNYITEKIGGLEKFCKYDLTQADVEIERTTLTREKNSFKVGVNFQLRQELLHTEQTEDTLYAAIDCAREEMESQLGKRRGRYNKKKRESRITQRALKSILFWRKKEE